MFQKFQSHEAKEIMHHGWIAGVVAAILVAVEVLKEGRFSEFSQHHPWRFFFLTLGFAFIGAFIVVVLWEHFLRLRRKKHLQDVHDTVDGLWAYTTKDVGSNQCTRASVAEISSSVSGFNISGYSYTREELKKHEGESHFQGQGSAWDGDKISFRYKGSETRDESVHPDRTGVGYYQFYRNSLGKLCIRGSFTGELGRDRERITRTLDGELVDHKAIKPLGEGRRTELLNCFRKNLGRILSRALGSTSFTKCFRRLRDTKNLNTS